MLQGAIAKALGNKQEMHAVKMKLAHYTQN